MTARATLASTGTALLLVFAFTSASSATPRARRQAAEAPSPRQLAEAALIEAFAPCTPSVLRWPAHLERGPRGATLRLERFESNVRGARGSAVFLLGDGATSTRATVAVQLSCPPPDIRSGDAVTAIARVGNVRASTPATSTAPGRVGESVDVILTASGRTVRARVVDSRTVEVNP